MKLRVISILLGFVFTFSASNAFAAWMYAENFTYFDASGNVIGQSLVGCSTATPRKASGVTSIYWREDVTLCDNQVGIIGESCMPSVNNDGHISWVCTPNLKTFEVKGVRNVRIDHLPPGLTDAASCSRAACSIPEPPFITALQAGVHSAGSESYPPNKNDCQALGGNCFAWLVQ